MFIDRNHKLEYCFLPGKRKTEKGRRKKGQEKSVLNQVYMY